MRWLMVFGTMLLLPLLLGCGGGQGDKLQLGGGVPSHLLTVNYLDELTVIPQSPGQPGTPSTEDYTVAARLWMFNNAPPMTRVVLHIPYFDTPYGMGGPYSVPADDGTNKQNASFKVYWGSSASVPAGQPLLVTPGMVMPGYYRPNWPLSLYVTSGSFSSPIGVSGSYRISAEQNFAQSWESPATQSMLAPVSVNEPSIIAVNALQPIHVSWEGVPGAIGYLVVADSLHDAKNSHGQQATWTSASQPIVFEAVDYHVPYLLPPTVHDVTIPAGIFRGCNTVLIRVLAHGAPYFDTKTVPNLRVICGSMNTEVFALFEH